jgi:VanZ family protein
MLWLCVIALESSDWLSARHTGGFLYPIFHYLFGLSPEQFEPIHFFTRKTGHFVGYGTLSVLAFRSWRALRNPWQPNWTPAWGRNAVLLTFTVASLDEFHQTFIPSRTGTFHDVVLDTTAGITAQILIYFFLRKQSPTTQTL